MNALKNVKESFTSLLERLKLARWIEIITEQPKCIYYFGSFATGNDAHLSSGGYIENLEQELAQEIAVDIKQGHPQKLTIFEEEMAGLETYFSSASSSLTKFWGS